MEEMRVKKKKKREKKEKLRKKKGKLYLLQRQIREVFEWLFHTKMNYTDVIDATSS